MAGCHRRTEEVVKHVGTVNSKNFRTPSLCDATHRIFRPTKAVRSQGVRSVRTSVTLGVASSVANDVMIHDENDVIMIIAGLWRYVDWRHVATGCSDLPVVLCEM